MGEDSAKRTLTRGCCWASNQQRALSFKRWRMAGAAGARSISAARLRWAPAEERCPRWSRRGGVTRCCAIGCDPAGAGELSGLWVVDQFGEDLGIKSQVASRWRVREACATLRDCEPISKYRYMLVFADQLPRRKNRRP